jgi:hypothetical protein
MRHGRTDENHAAFGHGMRAAGWLMADTSSCGEGFPDWVGCAPDGSMWAYEVKNPNKPPSQRALTPRQKAFHKAWHRCPTLLVVLCCQDALDAYNRRNST